MRDVIEAAAAGRISQLAAGGPSGAILLVVGLLVIGYVLSRLFQAVEQAIAAVHEALAQLTATYPVAVGGGLLVVAAAFTLLAGEDDGYRFPAMPAVVSVVGLGVMLVFAVPMGDAEGWRLLLALPAGVGLLVFVGGWAVTALACSTLPGRGGFVGGTVAVTGLLGVVWLWLFTAGPVDVWTIGAFLLPYVVAAVAWLRPLVGDADDDQPDESVTGSATGTEN